ncbi:SNF2 family N-terminal domain-domain-containing protein [Coniella lustricola]|uniref:SNF2 family N-terminal domain-domain-containing protein n=1 Tax=Coniella lustricola TaxID=2025994 RepID=A0A2T3AIU8_9PEZI|nr:SNF2 family N-terminal domain-domain-containing protein [Coniella lustricola]
MAFSSSPFTSPAGPGRRAEVIAASSPGSHQRPVALSDGDGDDDVVSDSSCSPYFTQPTQVLDRKTLGGKGTSGYKATQPTQIVDRPTLKGTKATQPTQIISRSAMALNARSPNELALGRSDSMSPRSDTSMIAGTIEVPRSSPFKASPAPLRRPHNSILGMLPPGTVYRPPQGTVQKNGRSSGETMHQDVSDVFRTGARLGDTRDISRPPKRKLSVGDSSDELSRTFKYRPRSMSSSSEGSNGADIIRTSFHRQEPAGPATPKLPLSRAAQESLDFERKYDARTQMRARKLREKTGRKFSLYNCAQMLARQKDDMEAAVKALLSHKGSSPPSPALVRSAATHSPSSAPEPRRRRLIRGRNPANAAKSPPQASTPLISLIDSDDDDKASIDSTKNDGDTYLSASDSDEDEVDTNEMSIDQSQDRSKHRSTKQAEAAKAGLVVNRGAKILEYLESCAADQLAADAKISKENAQYFISKRPFTSINQVKAVYHYKTVRKRREKVMLGEDVFDELNQHIKRLNAIDRVVQQCETQGKYIKSKIDSWRMDQVGEIKASGTGTEGGDVLPFPSEPESLKIAMFPYQLYGMNWMWQLYNCGFGGILADDMGTGKTCQVISFLALLLETSKSGLAPNKAGPNLVVVPPSVLDNWQNEFVKFAPDIRFIVYSGRPELRDELALEIMDSVDDYHVILTTFTQMSRTRDAIWMDKIGINTAFFDEGHKLKNPKIKTYTDLIRIRANWKVLITGTPIQNNIMEMISLLNFLSPQLFQRDREVIEELFMQKASLKEVSEGATLLSDRIQRARSILEPFILVRKKEQVSALPPKNRRVIYCDMPGSQKKVYDGLVTKFREAKQQKKMGKRSNDENNPWIQLRKAATHPQLFRRFYDDEKCEKMAKLLMKKVPHKLDQPDVGRMIEELQSYSDFELHLWCRDFECLHGFDCPAGSWYESGKLQKLIELVKEFKQNGDRVLIFSPFRRSLGIIEECLSESRVDYRIMVGETSVADRQVLVDEFQRNEAIPVFLLTTVAGGQGLNLTGANKIIIFDQSDNPQQDIQAENRAHRLGQKKDVDVIRLITKGTIDELIYKACKIKLELASQITGHGENIGISEESDIIAKVTDAIMNGAGGGDTNGDVEGGSSTPSGFYITPPKSEVEGTEYQG